MQPLINEFFAANNLPQVIGIWIAAFITLAVLSYILGENPLFRLMQYLFVGIAAGYAAAQAWNQILGPRLVRLVEAPTESWPYAVFFLLGIMLLARGWRPVANLATIPLALLIGTGTALALGGILTGTLVPQLAASIVSVSPASYGGGLRGWALALDAAFLLLSTVAVLAAFQYRRTGTGMMRIWYGSVAVLGQAGRLIIMVAFGAILAGAALTFFSILQARIGFLVFDWLGSFVTLGL